MQPTDDSSPERTAAARRALSRVARWGVAVTAVVVVLSPPVAGSASSEPTLFVDGANPACSDAGTGTSAAPYCTIGAAAADAVAGQTVQVATGTYAESVVLRASGTADAPITFAAAPDATPTLTGGTNGFALSGLQWVTIRGFTITRTTGYGISVSNSSAISVADNSVSYAGKPVSGNTRSGIYFSNVSDSVVSGNTVDHNTSYGVNLVSGSTRNRVEGNVSFANAMQYQRAASGIRFYGSPGNTVSRNVCHDNEDSGIEFAAGANDNLVVDNVTYGNGDHGIDNYKSPGQVLLGNTVYRNVTAGINVEGGSTGTTLANNIAVDNGISSPRTHSNIRIESGSTSGTTMDYDLVDLTAPDTLLIWNSVGYTSLSAFQAATGQELHGIDADPRWADRAAGDFHLLGDSPAIDSATSSVSGEPDTDADGRPRYDDPATPDTGAGPRTYDDRGAFELQPKVTPPDDAAPAAALTVAPASGTLPLPVTADASASTDTDATPIATYTFDFGDGSALVGPQTEAVATHTYSAAGTYTVTVTVRDSAGLAATATATVVVSAPEAPPAAVLDASPTSSKAPTLVTADASASTDSDATPIATYTFDFGDGPAVVGPQAGATAAHTYTLAGSYTITVTVTDTAGLSSTAIKRIKVR